MREIKDYFELSKDSIKEFKEEIKRIEKELINLTDEDEIEELKEQIKDETKELKGHIKEMNEEKTKIENIKNDKNHSLKKLVIGYVNSTVHGDDWKDKI